MDDEDNKCDCPPPGLPLWMGTFADLMSLLMCFFVLLLSFSEMDVLKFKQIAGSMKFAFGVQNQLEVKDIPKGTSIIAQEFRPGRPEPTPTLLIILWVICIFIKISFIMYVVATVISQMLGLKESRPIVLPVVATVSLMSLVMVKSSAQFLELETAGFATMLIFAELVPILYLVVDLIRFGKKKPAKQGGVK